MSRKMTSEEKRLTVMAAEYGARAQLFEREYDRVQAGWDAAKDQIDALSADLYQANEHERIFHNDTCGL